MPYFDVETVIEVDEFYKVLTRHERKTMWELLKDEFYESSKTEKDNSIFSKIEWGPLEIEGKIKQYEVDPSHVMARAKTDFPFEDIEYEEIAFSELLKAFLTEDDDTFNLLEGKLKYNKPLFQMLLLQAPISEMRFFYPKKVAPLVIKTPTYKYGLAPRVEEVDFEDEEEDWDLDDVDDEDWDAFDG